MTLQLAMDAAALAGVGGYVSGIAATVETSAYIDAALSFIHVKMTTMLDIWLDGAAKSNARELQHVYEWPTTYHNYDETVGNPEYRLWQNTLTGRGKNKVASFRFMASKRPSPVNPQLTQNDNGRHVKEGVHIFVWKAPAMEYGYAITVEPKLARYLAYVFSDGAEGDGHDGGREDGTYSVKTHKDGRTMAFSQGPVTFKAGGDVTYMRFTTLYLYWWQTMAPGVFADLAPRLQSDIVNEAALGRIIRQGNMKTKTGSLTAQASKYTGDWQAAAAIAKAELKKKEGMYIEAARARRIFKYGEEGMRDG